ncbi:MAG: HsmA family protein [Patescibacteria group bacterium]
MFFAIVFIIFALILYTISIWSERIKRGLKSWMLALFVAGFVSDLIGTSIMSFMAAGVKFNTHSICGYLALLIMGLHLIWAIRAYWWHGKAEILFNKYSTRAWLVWLVAFISGIPKI